MQNGAASTPHVFRERLSALLAEADVNRSQFAKRAGIDRSTVTQLLAPDNHRMPRVDTVISIAQSFEVSIDWLLGRSTEGYVSAEMLEETATIEGATLTEQDERLMAWWEASRGYKVRYVPQTLPDLFKTDEVIEFEQQLTSSASASQRQETAANRLSWVEDPTTELEICSPRQALADFAIGAGVWSEFPAPSRLAAIDHMIELVERLYPTLRWFLFDGRERYSVPITIFGPTRASIYLGQGYLVLTSASHVRTFIQQFDQHIRQAVVNPPDIPRHLAELRWLVPGS